MAEGGSILPFHSHVTSGGGLPDVNIQKTTSFEMKLQSYFRDLPVTSTLNTTVSPSVTTLSIGRRRNSGMYSTSEE